MSILFYRLRFDRNPEREPINDAAMFSAWLRENLSALKPSFAGYVSSDQQQRRHARGEPLWQAICNPIDAENIFTYLSERQWVVDGYTVILSYKPGPGENEIVIPIFDKAR